MTRAQGGLFRRIFVTFVLTVVASTVVSAVGAFLIATRVDQTWVDKAMDSLEAHEPALAAAADDEQALEAELAAIASELGGEVAAYRRGRGAQRVAGRGPDQLPAAVALLRRELRRGPVTFRAGLLRGRGLALAVGGRPRDRRNPPVVIVAYPRAGKNLGLPVIVALLLLAVLSGGAWVLSRSIARRLRTLGEGADRIASGDLEHRIDLPAGPPTDEIDLLGRDFNEMAAKLQTLLRGQQTLLANVSHELRTPLARIKVLLEILQERVERLAASAGPQPTRDLTRLDKGMHEMTDDIREIEALISDLLTSGRLQLREGAGVPLQRDEVDMRPMLERLARKVDAKVDLADPNLRAPIDRLLIERLLSNLLANGRRACPDGELVVAARMDGDRLRLTVSDTGPGVEVEHREAIFEPFTRLDAARDRDRGGVGLGLYLARQICAAHGGTIEVTDRPDGRSGAHFVIELPRRAAATGT